MAELVDQLAADHPAVPHLQTRDDIAAAVRAYAAADGMAAALRAYGNIWTAAEGYTLSPEQWSAVQTSTGPPPAPTPVTFAVEATPDRSRGVIAAAWHDPDGRPCAGIVATSGAALAELMTMTGDLMAARPGSVLVRDPRSPAATLDLPDQVRPIEPAGSDAIAATEQLLDAIGTASIRIQSDPVLDTAARGAITRQTDAGQQVWSRRRSVTDVTPLVAAGYALYQLDRGNGDPVLLI